MRPFLTAAVVALAVAAAAAGCGESPGPITQQELAERLEEDGLGQEFAECVAEEIYPELTTDEREALNEDQADSDTRDTLNDKARDAGAACADQGIVPEGGPGGPSSP